jgi:hypothetical protein
MATVTLGETVRVVNNGEQDIKLFWNSRPYTITADGDTYVPFEIVKTFFGDPRSTDAVSRVKDEQGNDMIIADRTAEVIRLKNYWQDSSFGTNNAKFREYVPGDRSWVEEGISDLIPKVSVYTLSGERIYTVVDDPHGDNVMVATNTRAQADQQQAQLLEQSQVIIKQQRQIDMLMNKLGLSVDHPISTQESVLEAPTNGAEVEAPEAFLYNPRTKRVSPRNPNPPSDPTDIKDLPQDTD